MTKAILALGIILMLAAQNKHAQLNMTQLGYFDVVNLHGSDASDIWGYVDGAGNEYAIVGLHDGTSIVNITDPTSAFEVFYEPGMNSVWRDIKTFGHYAYVTTEAQNGLLIIDLSPLPGSSNLSTVYYNGPVGQEWQSAHNLYIDEFGYCYIFGANRGEGGTIILDLNGDPMNPVEVGVEDSYYTHDGVVRNNILYQAHILDGFFTVHDISDKQNPIFLGQRNTPGNFSHNVWFSDDDNYMYTTDEISNGYLGEYDISDPSNIQFLDKIQSSPGMDVIPHNVHFINDYIVTSYYRDGVTVHDVSNKGNMVEVGNFDTSPAFSGNGFNGCWGVYPWLPSGNIIASDIENGLYILGANYTRGAYLEGVITDAVTGNPIATAQVKIVSTTVMDESLLNGQYQSGLAVAGTYDIVYSHPFYVSDTVYGVSLVNGSITVQDVALFPVETFDLIVSTEDVDEAVILNVEIQLSNEQFFYSGNTGSNGTYTFSNLVPGEYELIVGKWGFVTRCEIIDVSADNSLLVVMEKGYYDDFTFDFNWVVSGNAPSGSWERGVPVGTEYNNLWMNPNEDVDGDCGTFAYVTGNAGGQAGSDDLDIGVTILTSPVMDLTGYINPQLNCQIWWQNQGGNGVPNDTLKVILKNGTTEVVAQIFRNINSASAWQPVVINFDDFLQVTSTMQVEFNAADWQDFGGHLVEAGVDHFIIEDNLSSNIASPVFDDSIMIYPNPSNGHFTVSGSDLNSYRIMSLTGKLIQSGSIRSPMAEIGESLPAGMYLLELSQLDGRVSIYKVIKNN
jgi:choice-of-anchor B domain-containing protein